MKKIISAVLIIAIMITQLGSFQGYSETSTSDLLDNASLNVSSDTLYSWVNDYYSWLDKYSRNESPNIISADNLAVASFHNETGRNNYFAPGSGTSEAQFLSIRSFVEAYKATNDPKWLSRAEDLANKSLEKLFPSSSIPTGFENTNIWVPHWLYNAKAPFRGEQYYLDKVANFNNGVATINTGYTARKVFSVRAMDAKLEWSNPFSKVIGTSYPISSYQADGNTLTIRLTNSYSGDALVAYSDMGGEIIDNGSVYEAWPVWRNLEDTETDCAVDSLWWAYDSFDLLAETTGSSKWLQARNVIKDTIPQVLKVDNSKDYLTSETATSDPLSTVGTYIYQDRNPSASIIRNTRTGQVEMNIPSGNGTVQLGRGGLNEQWTSDDMYIEAELSSNVPTMIQCYIDPQAGYNENTRWRADLKIKGAGNLEKIMLKRSDFVRPTSLIWSPYYIPGKSFEDSYRSDHSQVNLTKTIDTEGREVRKAELYRGVETGTWSEQVTDPLTGITSTVEHTFTYRGWAQYDIKWDKEKIVLNDLPNMRYRSSGEMNIRIEDSEGWIWKMPLPQSSSFREYKPSINNLTINGDWQKNQGTPPSTPVLPIKAIVLDAVDNSSWVELSWLGNLEVMPLSETINTILLSATDSNAAKLTVSHLRPLPTAQLPYSPYVAPFTVNVLDRKIVSWRGTPYTGYQAPYIWQEIGNQVGVTTVLQFMKDSQDAYHSRIGLRGPFAPLFIWDRWDTKEYGNAGEWTWNGPDPNTSWGGFQYRSVEAVSRAWKNDPSNMQAKQVTMDFLNWINRTWVSPDSPIPTNFPENGSPYGTADEPHMAALLLKASLYAYQAGGDKQLTIGLINRCLLYLNKLYIQPGDVNHPMVAGTWSPDPSNNLWYGFWGAEIVDALSMLLIEVDKGYDESVSQEYIANRDKLHSDAITIVSSRNSLDASGVIINQYYNKVITSSKFQQLLSSPEFLEKLTPKLNMLKDEPEYIKFLIARNLGLQFKFSDQFLNNNAIGNAWDQVYYNCLARNQFILQGNYESAEVAAEIANQYLNYGTLSGLYQNLVTVLQSGIKQEIKASARQIVLGNYSDDVTLTGTMGQIMLGFSGLDLPGDIRDISYDISNWEWSKTHGLMTVVDCVSVLPFLGVMKNAADAKKIIHGGETAEEITSTALRTTIREINPNTDAVLIDRVKGLRGILPHDPRTSGNIALASISINGVQPEMFASSRIPELKNAGNAAVQIEQIIALKPINPVFEAFDVPTSNGKLLERVADAEFNILNKIESTLGENTSVSGEIILYTDLIPCPSCENVIQEFLLKYKNIRIDIIHNNGVRLK